MLTVPRSHAAYLAHVASYAGQYRPRAEHGALPGLLARLDLAPAREWLGPFL
jgi:hypothetical protein